MAIRVTVLYFGQAREAAGRGEERVSLPARSSVGALVELSGKSHHKLRAVSPFMRVAVNERVAEDEDLLEDGDVVAFLPPVAGG